MTKKDTYKQLADEIIQDLFEQLDMIREVEREVAKHHLGEEMGIEPPTLGRYFSGDLRYRMDIFFRLCLHLEVDPVKLIQKVWKKHNKQIATKEVEP